MIKKYITNPDKIKAIRTDADSREITMTKGHDENWIVYVSDNTMLTKLKRLMSSAPEGFVKCWAADKNPEGYPSGYFFELHPKCISFRSGKSKKSKELTPEEKAKKRAAFVERTQKARANKRGNLNF